MTTFGADNSSSYPRQEEDGVNVNGNRNVLKLRNNNYIFFTSLLDKITWNEFRNIYKVTYKSVGSLIRLEILKIRLAIVCCDVSQFLYKVLRYLLYKNIVKVLFDFGFENVNMKNIAR